ncbi:MULTISPECIES: GntR family transcriptional regulator [unclassified Pseudomonas]|uniref:GntR family transcriptional regulator n=1 Tax=unclassified Pseudomonas TaxID=196821 RepID=UPI0030D78680
MTGSLDSFVVPDKHRYKTAMSFVVDVLRQGVLTGAIAEGTPLRQDDLAAKFGLSRMPIRDAIRQLEAEGLVVYEPHKGATVATMTIDDIVEIYDMRIMAECTALKLAFGSIKGERIAELNSIIQDMETADLDQFRALNQQFFAVLFQPVQRPRLHSLIKSLHDSVERYLQFILIDLDHQTQSVREYKMLTDACAAGDQIGAVKALKSHLSNAQKTVVSFLKSRQTSSP